MLVGREATVRTGWRVGTDGFESWTAKEGIGSEIRAIVSFTLLSDILYSAFSTMMFVLV